MDWACSTQSLSWKEKRDLFHLLQSVITNKCMYYAGRHTQGAA